MRVAFAVVLLAVAASAVNLEQTSTRLQQVVRGSGFGQNVLSELQSKLAAGSPVSELKDIINDIRTRLNEAQLADNAQNEAHQAQCKSDLETLDGELRRLDDQITSLNSQISKTEDQIQATGNEIDQKTNEINQDNRDIKDTEDRMTKATADRAAAKELYDNRTRDTTECINAIKEIEGLDLNGDGVLDLDHLESGQNDQASNYQGANNEYAALLEKVAAKTHDETAKSFVQLTALSMQGLTGSDVSNLKQLLTDLKNELNEYQNELTSAEAQSIADYNALMEAEQATLDNQKRTLQAHIDEREALKTRRAKETEHLSALNVELSATTNDRNESQSVRDATETKCKNLKAQYDERTTQRSEEQDTLDQIERIIDEKLVTGKLADHAEKRVENVTSVV